MTTGPARNPGGISYSSCQFHKTKLLSRGIIDIFKTEQIFVDFNLNFVTNFGREKKRKEIFASLKNFNIASANYSNQRLGLELEYDDVIYTSLS